MQLVWMLLPLVATVNADCNLMGKPLKSGEEGIFFNFVALCDVSKIKFTHCLMSDKITRIAIGESLVQGDTRSSCLLKDGSTTPTFQQTSQSKWQSENSVCEDGKPVGSTWSDAKYSYSCDKGADGPKKTITACILEGGATLAVGNTKIVSTKNFECKRHPNGDVELIVAVVADPPTTTTKPEVIKDILAQTCTQDNKEFLEGQEYIAPKYPIDTVTYTCKNGEMVKTACAVNGVKLEVGESRVAGNTKYTCNIDEKGKITRSHEEVTQPKRCEGNKMSGEEWTDDTGKLVMLCTADYKTVVKACWEGKTRQEIEVGTKIENDSKIYECKKFTNGSVALVITEIPDGRTPCSFDGYYRTQNSTWSDDTHHYKCTFNTENKKPEAVIIGCATKNRDKQSVVVLIGEKKEIDSVVNECVKFPNGTVAMVTPEGCKDTSGIDRQINEEWTDFKDDRVFKKQCLAGGVIQIIACVTKKGDEIKVGENKQYDYILNECKKFANGTIWLVETDLSCKDDKGTVRKPGDQWEVKETKVTWECKNGKAKVVFCKYDHFGRERTMPYLGRYRVFEKEQRCEEQGMKFVDPVLGG